MGNLNCKMTEPKTKPMPLLELIILIAALVAAFIAEGALTSYKNFQGAAQNIYADEQRAVDAFKGEQYYRSRAEALKLNLAQLTQSIQDKQERNRKALAANGGRVLLYSEEIRKDSEKLSALQAEFDAWEAAQLAPIRAQFADKRLRASESSFVGFVSGVSFSWFVPFLVLALCYLSTRQFDQWRWVLLGLSFVPQCVSSQMAFDGAMMKYGQKELALSISAMFFFCLPVMYHFGIIAIRSRQTFCVEEAAPPELEQKSEQSKGRFSHTSTTSFEFELTDEGYQKAIALVAAERKKGNGHGMFTEISKRFPVAKAAISRDIKSAMAGKTIRPRIKS